MAHPWWTPETPFRKLVLEPAPNTRDCAHCGRFTYIYEHRERRLHLLEGPLHLVSKIAHCPDRRCPGHREVVESPEEMGLAPPHWAIGWDVFAWVGHRRFARSWSVPQICAELLDRFGIRLSWDAVEGYVHRYQTMVAARESADEALAAAYRDIPDLILSIDGLQPEKGHETLYVIRELRAKRVWFATPLLSSAASEVRRLFEQVAAWAQRLGKPVKLWISDKQDAFVTGIAAVFPEVPHRYCKNHFLRDLAKPILARDRHAKVQMRRKVRGLRAIEQRILRERAASADAPTAADVAAPETTGAPTLASAPRDDRPSPSASTVEAQEVVLGYTAAVRGILNDDQGGPLHPPGLRMSEALTEVQASLRRSLKGKKSNLAPRS